ncbi:polysaccharide deacetylase family protein [Candidatus Woesearchaeota archaeon]|nr:polysaccharide deacetylase family protein [Candidatus Woesearchaeota archaeon]
MTGIFVLSLDEELLWGVSSRSDRDYFKWGVDKERKVFKRFLDLLDKHEIKATFAIVGHMMLQGRRDCPDKGCFCKGVDERYAFGRDVVRMIRERGHEIGIHGHTHSFFDELSKREADEELFKAVAAARSLGIEAKSMVFPQNRVAHQKSLSRHGISAYRGADEWWFSKFPGFVQKPLHLLDYLFTVTPPVYKARREKAEGGVLYNLPGSMFYLARDGFRRYVPMGCRVKKAIKGMDKAINEDKVFHLWFHPFNLSWDSGEMLKGLDQILAYAAEKRKRGELRTMTMQEVVRYEDTRHKRDRQ